MKKLNIYIYYFLKVIGVCPFKFESENHIQFSVFGRIYIITLIIMYTYAFSKALKYRSEIIMYEETPLAIILDIFSIVFNYLAIVASWLIFISRPKSVLKIIELFKKLRTLERDFHMNQSKDYLDQVAIQIKKHFIIGNILFLIGTITQLLALDFCQDLKRQTTFWLFYNIPVIVVFNISLSLIKFMNFSRECYKVLNAKANLLLFYESKTERTSQTSLSQIPRRITQELCMICYHHMSLTNFCELIVQFLSLPILLMLCANFTHTVSSVHAICQFFIHREQDTSSACILYSPLMRLLNFVTIAFFTCSVPVWTSDEARKTVGIINQFSFDLYLEKSSREIMQTVVIILLQKKLKTSIFGLFNLDFTLLQNIWTTTVTYLIFMLQLDDLL